MSTIPREKMLKSSLSNIPSKMVLLKNWLGLEGKAERKRDLQPDAVVQGAAEKST